MTDANEGARTTDEIVEPADSAENADDGVGPGGAGGSPSSADYSVAFSPRQVAVGFAIVAGLVAIALSRRRRRDKPTGD
jgi:hypothetical protein